MGIVCTRYPAVKFRTRFYPVEMGFEPALIDG